MTKNENAAEHECQKQKKCSTFAKKGGTLFAKNSKPIYGGYKLMSLNCWAVGLTPR